MARFASPIMPISCQYHSAAYHHGDIIMLIWKCQISTCRYHHAGYQSARYQHDRSEARWQERERS